MISEMEKEKNADWWKRVSEIARLGSGSACRSLYSSMSLWGKTDGVEASSDLYAIPWKEKTNPFIPPSKTRYSSSVLLKRNFQFRRTSINGIALLRCHPVFHCQVENSRLITVLQEPALINKFIAVVESEALQLHALMMSGMNPFLLLSLARLPSSKKSGDSEKKADCQSVLLWMQAPNVHLLYPAECKAKVAEWIQNELVKHCAGEQVILDRVGSGPEKLS
jgi:diphosphomevalonate decarboxylase